MVVIVTENPIAQATPLLKKGHTATPIHIKLGAALTTKLFCIALIEAGAKHLKTIERSLPPAIIDRRAK